MSAVRLLARAAIAWVFLLWSPASAETNAFRTWQAETLPGTPSSRRALVIGNGAYASQPLRNPAGDAALMARTLAALGFEVAQLTNADQKTMKRAIRDFGQALLAAGPEAVGLFYFAGHGVQLRGENYLIPIGAQIVSEADVDIEGIEASDLLRQMEFAGNALNIVVLDACRNNPFARSFRSAEQGLAKMDAPTGSIVAYSTAPGQVARDGDGTNSPYTEALVRRMRTPGLPVEQMFKAVRNDVIEESRKQQIPWESSSLTGDFYFLGPTVILQGSPPAADAGPPDPELIFWDSIKASRSASDYDAYVSAYPSGRFTALARSRSAEYRQATAAVAQRPQTMDEPPVNASTRVVAFTYMTPPQEVDPGLRQFRLAADGTWSNRYPSGHVDARFRTRRRILLDGCAGTVIGRDSEPEFALFIPDKGCPGMMARWQRSGSHWHILGRMENVE